MMWESFMRRHNLRRRVFDSRQCNCMPKIQKLISPRPIGLPESGFVLPYLGGRRHCSLIYENNGLDLVILCKVGVLFLQYLLLIRTINYYYSKFNKRSHNDMIHYTCRPTCRPRCNFYNISLYHLHLFYHKGAIHL